MVAFEKPEQGSEQLFWGASAPWDGPGGSWDEMGKAVARTELPGTDPAAGFDSRLEEFFSGRVPQM